MSISSLQLKMLFLILCERFFVLLRNTKKLIKYQKGYA